MPDGSRIVKTFEKDSAKKLGGDQDALSLAHRALAALRALRRRCSGVMLSARRLPPILPPSRPSSDRIWDLRDLAGCTISGSGSTGGRSPNNLCTAMKPAWTSSSGSLPDGFRIRLQLGTFGRFASSLWKTKVAHYRDLRRPAWWVSDGRMMTERQNWTSETNFCYVLWAL